MSDRDKSISDSLIRACCFWCCSLSLVYGIFIVVCVSLYETHSPEYDLTLPVVPEDNVIILYKEKDYDKLISQTIRISLNTTSVDSDSVQLKVYDGGDCKGLSEYTYVQSSTSNDTLAIDCIDRCEVDAFLYFLNDPRSSLTYRIFYDELFDHYTTQYAHFILFNDYNEFESFISGSNTDFHPLQEVVSPIVDNATVKFDLSIMNAPSYLFVAYELLYNSSTDIGNSNVTHFSLIRQMSQVLFNISFLSTIKCSTTSCTDRQVYINNHRQCYIVRLIQNNRTSTTTISKSSIQVTAEDAHTDVEPVFNVIAHISGSAWAIFLSIFLGGILIVSCSCFLLICFGFSSYVLCRYAVTRCRGKRLSSLETDYMYFDYKQQDMPLEPNDYDLPSSSLHSAKNEYVYNTPPKSVADVEMTGFVPDKFDNESSNDSTPPCEPSYVNAIAVKCTEHDDITPSARANLNCLMIPSEVWLPRSGDYTTTTTAGSSINSLIKDEANLQQPPIESKLSYSFQQHSAEHHQSSIDSDDDQERSIGRKQDIQLRRSDILTATIGTSEEQLKKFEEPIIKHVSSDDDDSNADRSHIAVSNSTIETS